MKSLTVIYITARKDPALHWFLTSLASQGVSDVTVIVVDALSRSDYGGPLLPGLVVVPPKPNVWQGPHRLTKEDWWAISNARNTGICLCQTEWIAFCDDRCVLAPTWLKAVQDAMAGNYAVSGSYEKRSGMTVENGVITNPGTVIGADPRTPNGYRGKARQTFGDDYYGCTSACPLEWCLEMNGWDETCDGLGLEDVVFGNMLVQNGHITKYDSNMKIIEDRSPEACVNMPKRTDKGPFATENDKSHALLRKIGASKRAIHPFDIRTVRNLVQAGEPWPIPTEPSTDWYDGEKLGDMYVR